MAKEFDSDLLATMLKAKRGDKALRAVSDEMDNVSASTLSRIEQGKVPDLETFIKICKWLKIPTDTFAKGTVQTNDSGKDSIINQLRAEKELEQDTVNMLVKMIDLAYSKKSGKK